MKLVILLLVLPCLVRASKEQCSNGTQSCLIDGLQTCCDIQLSEDAGLIKPFYAAAKQSHYLKDSSTNASLNVQHGLNIPCSMWCDGKCCTSDECCPHRAGVCCLAVKGCCPSGHNCCNGGCCESGKTCCDEGCCESGQNCCGDGCCESGHYCCGDGCCPTFSTCCPKHNHCCIPGYSCCADEKGCCSSASECCGEYCCPSGSKCCGGKWCCENTKKCGLTLGSCFGSAGILSPTVSALIVMFVLILKMRFT